MDQVGTKAHVFCVLWMRSNGENRLHVEVSIYTSVFEYVGCSSVERVFVQNPGFNPQHYRKQAWWYTSVIPVIVSSRPTLVHMDLEVRLRYSRYI